MKIITEKEFNSAIEKGITLVDFFATWCGPCHIMGHILEDVEEDLGEVKVVKVDVDSSPNLAKEYQVMSIPTLIVFKDGKLVEKHVGVWDEEEMIDFLDQLQAK